LTCLVIVNLNFDEMNDMHGLPLWPDGQRFLLLQIESSRVRCGSLSLVSTTEEPFGRNSSGSSLENLDYGRGEPPR
jgi:hypothetical protein